MYPPNGGSAWYISDSVQVRGRYGTIIQTPITILLWTQKLPYGNTCGMLMEGHQNFHGQNSCYQTDLSGNAWYVPPSWGTPLAGERKSGFHTPGIFETPYILEIRGFDRFTTVGVGTQTISKVGHYIHYNAGWAPFDEDSSLSVKVTWDPYSGTYGTAFIDLDIKTSYQYENYSFSSLKYAHVKGHLECDLVAQPVLLHGKLSVSARWSGQYVRPELASEEFDVDYSSGIYPRRVTLSTYPEPNLDVTPSSIPLVANYMLLDAVRYFEQPSVSLMSTLCYEALASRNYFTGNMLALIGDFKNLYEDFESQVGNIKDFANALKQHDFKKALLAGDSQYLATKYGYHLTYSDTKDLLFSLRKAMEDGAFLFGSHWTVRAKDTMSYTNRQGYVFNCTYSWTGELVEPDNLFLSGIYRAMQWDYWPSLGNMWDFIPYSFCVDWLVAIGPLLENLDTAITTLYLRLAWALATFKVEYVGSFSTILSPEWAGECHLKCYDRQLRTAFEPFPFLSWKGGGLEGHFLEATGLITQRFL